MIGTVASDQSVILAHNRQLHNHGEPFHADLTYGSGGFWRTDPEQTPAILVDLEAPKRIPRVPRLQMQADVRALPFRKNSIRSAVFDPPFMHAPGQDSLMGQRFGGYRSQAELRCLYQGAAGEIGRALTHGGLLVWKCQDVVESGWQVWTHIDVHRIVMGSHTTNWLAEDLFILTKESRMVGWNQHNQQHARKHHCYFWVFRKH